jgi:hypothetical protein
MDLFYDARDDAHHEPLGSRILYWLDDLDALPLEEADPASEGFLVGGGVGAGVTEANKTDYGSGCPTTSVPLARRSNWWPKRSLPSMSQIDPGRGEEPCVSCPLWPAGHARYPHGIGCKRGKNGLPMQKNDSSLLAASALFFQAPASGGRFTGPHKTGVNIAASLHFIAALPNTHYFEYCVEQGALR